MAQGANIASAPLSWQRDTEIAEATDTKTETVMSGCGYRAVAANGNAAGLYRGYAGIRRHARTVGQIYGKREKRYPASLGMAGTGVF